MLPVLTGNGPGHTAHEAVGHLSWLMHQAPGPFPEGWSHPVHPKPVPSQGVLCPRVSTWHLLLLSFTRSLSAHFSSPFRSLEVSLTTENILIDPSQFAVCTVGECMLHYLLHVPDNNTIQERFQYRPSQFCTCYQPPGIV